MKKVRWGILSTAKIGVAKVIPGMQKVGNCEIVAISSREESKAKQAARQLNIPKAHGSYEVLLADPEIDAIYNPLPNHLHVPWTLKALEAGKHVLCEKPIALSAVEAQSLVDAAANYPQLKVMEAFMYRFHPQWRRTKEIVASGGVGELRAIQTFFSYFNDRPEDIRNQTHLGGGSLMDIGCYGISVARYLFDREPRRVLGLLDNDPRFLCDRMSNVVLDFGSGHTATFTCSTQLRWQQRVNIVGTTGRVELNIPFNMPPDKNCHVLRETEFDREDIELPPADQYGLQGEAFSESILEDTEVPTPLTDAVANMRVLDAIRASARGGMWESV